MANEIVVGYDGSEGARTALTAAIDMAKKLSADLVIVYGYEVSKFGGEVTDLAAALLEQGQSLVAEAGQIANEAGLDARVEVIDEHPAEAIADLATALGAQMIVVATRRGEKPLRGVIVGSMAPKLLHLATVPVLVVPA
jgi:nucleotide-binding universal stress UspA family protein